MFSFQELQSYIDNGLITISYHPEASYVCIFNYTRKCQYGCYWDNITLKCRGLIMDINTNEILARPFDKFFNYSELQESLPEGQPEATVKLDGSLGISYRFNGRVCWATRGSFTSPQAQVAQKIWDTKYNIDIPDNITLLAEIISPETRVVVNYDFTDLVLVGARDRHTGRDYCHDELSDIAAWIGMPVVQRVDLDLEQALATAKTLDHQHEGFVLRWPNGFRVKIKGGQYLQVFRIVYGLNTKTAAKAWIDGTLDDLIASVPEEFIPELVKTKNDLDCILSQYLEYLRLEFARAPVHDRKSYALWVQSSLPSYLQPMAFGLYNENEDRYMLQLRRAVVNQYFGGDYCA